MRNQIDIDHGLRRLGYFLRRVPRGAASRAKRWQVLSLASHTGWDCATLAEARSLLRALREREARGGRRVADVVWDGDGWTCVDVDVDTAGLAGAGAAGRAAVGEG